MVFFLPVTSNHVKLSQYADDTTTFVSSDQSILALFRLFSHYEKASGAKLNPTKCHGLLTGSWKSRTTYPVELLWSSSHITVLGSRIGNDLQADWEPLYENLANLLTSWKQRTLSFHSCSLIVNSLGLSTFWYLAYKTLKPCDKTLIKPN